MSYLKQRENNYERSISKYNFKEYKDFYIYLKSVNDLSQILVLHQSFKYEKKKKTEKKNC